MSPAPGRKHRTLPEGFSDRASSTTDATADAMSSLLLPKAQASTSAPRKRLDEPPQACGHSRGFVCARAWSSEVLGPDREAPALAAEQRHPATRPLPRHRPQRLLREAHDGLQPLSQVSSQRR